MNILLVKQDGSFILDYAGESDKNSYYIDKIYGNDEYILENRSDRYEIIIPYGESYDGTEVTGSNLPDTTYYTDLSFNNTGFDYLSNGQTASLTFTGNISRNEGRIIMDGDSYTVSNLIVSERNINDEDRINISG